MCQTIISHTVKDSPQNKGKQRKKKSGKKFQIIFTLLIEAIVLKLRFLKAKFLSLSRCADNRFTWLFLAISHYQSSFLASLLGGIQCPHRADKCKFLLID